MKLVRRLCLIGHGIPAMIAASLALWALVMLVVVGVTLCTSR